MPSKPSKARKSHPRKHNAAGLQFFVGLRPPSFMKRELKAKRKGCTV